MSCTNATTCAHLFTNGASDTIVRLPDSCGTGPFARLTVITQQPSSTDDKSKNIVTEGTIWNATLNYDFKSELAKYFTA